MTNSTTSADNLGENTPLTGADRGKDASIGTCQPCLNTSPARRRIAVSIGIAGGLATVGWLIYWMVEHWSDPKNHADPYTYEPSPEPTPESATSASSLSWSGFFSNASTGTDANASDNLTDVAINLGKAVFSTVTNASEGKTDSELTSASVPAMHTAKIN